MTSGRKFFLFTLILGLAGYVFAWFAFPKYNPAVDWHYQLSRQTAIERARASANILHPELNVSSWNAYLTTKREGPSDYFRHQHPDQWLNIPALTPITTSVRFIEPAGPSSGKRSITIDLAADGQATGYTFSDASKEKKDSGVTPDSQTAQDARPLGEASLRQLAGNTADGLQFVSQTEEGKNEGTRLTWEQKLTGTDEVKLKATALVQNQIIREIKLTPVFAPSFLNIYYIRNISIWRDPLTVLLGLATVMLALVMFFIGLSKRQLSFRSSLIFLLVLSLLNAATRLAAGVYDATRLNIAPESTPVLIIGAALSAVLLPSLIFALTFSLLWITGLWLARRSNTERYLSFLNLIKGKFNRQEIGSRLLTGFLLGGMVVAIPLFVAASGFFPGFSVNRPDPDLFVAPFPLISALWPGLRLNLFTLYGLLIPFGAVYFGAGRKFLGWRVAVILPISFIWMIDDAVAQRTTGAILLTALLLVLFADWLFWKTDLLTLICAFMSADITLNALTLVHMSDRGLRLSGWLKLASLCACALLSYFIQKMGSDASLTNDPEAVARENEQEEQKAERERLVAEFGVARSAQERMLPKEFPVIPGYQISAHCTPAREVGGDLFDFVRLPNERLGIVVADVSGKGVPAALYMTLTKGLIASISESESDPHRILCEVNRHLYEVCRRKVFVTMMMGVLEPATGNFTYARAGHNPALWRKPQAEQTEWLKSPGIGLGLDRGSVFERTLKTSTVQLKQDDALVLYSDGLTEAMNVSSEEYGENRLQQIIEQTDGMSANQTLQAVLEDVEFFLQGISHQDDLTLIVIRATD